MAVNSSGSPRRARALRDRRPGNRLAGRDIPQHPPYALLERRAADIERQIKANARGLDNADYPRDQRLIVRVAADEMRFCFALL